MIHCCLELVVEEVEGSGEVTNMSETYEQLVANRNRLKALMDKHSNLKTHSSYKLARKQYDEIVTEIKLLVKK